jgi:hypothetical protein
MRPDGRIFVIGAIAPTIFSAQRVSLASIDRAACGK